MRLPAALLAALALAGGGCSDTADDPPDDAGSSTSATTEATGAAAVELPPIEEIGAAGGATLDIDDADWIQVVSGDAWTSVPGAVVRLDAKGRETARVEADPGSCLAMDVGYGSLWVGVCDERAPAVLRIDLGTGKLVATVPLPPGQQFVPEGSLGAGEGFVWVVTTTAAADKALVSIDPATNRVVGQRRAPLTVAGVRAGLGGVWLTDPSNARLVRMDPDDGRVVARIPVGAGARFFAIGEGAVWVQNNSDGTVTRVDPETDEPVATIPVDEFVIEGGDLAVGGGFVWARVSESLVTQIDPATDEAVARYGVPQGSGSVAADGDAVWITAHDVDAIYRVPLR